jgi:8-oxo-dGTP diphosphatase
MAPEAEIDRLPREAAPRFCTRCGSRLAERAVDGRRRLACPACPYVRFDGPGAVAGAIVRRLRHGVEEVLLVRPVEPPALAYHVLVSGYLEPYETAEAAAIREVKEETGLDVAIERVLGTYSCRAIGRNLVLIVCLARVTGGELRLSEELADARWFSTAELPAWPPDWPLARAFADLAEAGAAGAGALG